MTYFPDLTPYIYFKDRGGINVGWLESGHPFPTGNAPQPFLDRLTVLHRDYKSQATRGQHRCSLCAPGADSIAVGNAEIAVLFEGKIYRTPSLILHYVVHHQYLPPPEFIEAVMYGAPVS